MSSNVIDVIKTISNLFIFLRKDFACTKSTKSPKRRKSIEDTEGTKSTKSEKTQISE